MRRLVPALVVVAACSLLNREGPAVTCADLGNGATNACADGILATCVGTRVEYKVCDLASACEQGWQTKGAYRCSESEPAPQAGGGDGGTTPVGQAPDGGACGPGVPCILANTGVNDIAIDDANIYVTDCSNVKRISKTGGVLTPLATGLTGCGARGMFVDNTDVYVLDGTSGVSRVPKTGGAFTKVLPSPSTVSLFTIDGANVYWSDSSAHVLKATPKAGGTTTTLTTTTDFRGTRMVVEDGFVYWLDNDNVNRVATNVASPTAPSTIALGRTPSDFVAVGDAVYFTVEGGSSEPGGVWKVPLSGGAPTEMASGLSGVIAVAADTANVYFATYRSIGKVPKGGGPAATIVTVETPIEGRIMVDEKSVYWGTSSQLMRVNK